MMNFFHELLCVVGCALALIGMLAGLLCSLPFVFWFMGVGLSMMALGMGLDKWSACERKWERSNRW